MDDTWRYSRKRVHQLENVVRDAVKDAVLYMPSDYGDEWLCELCGKCTLYEDAPPFLHEYDCPVLRGKDLLTGIRRKDDAGN